LLFTITQQTGQGVDGLLNAVYGFLQRRTDFFYEMEPGDKMGFPPGVAESMVRLFTFPFFEALIEIFLDLNEESHASLFRFIHTSRSIKTSISRGSRTSLS
jgi:hypothetical protein